MSAIEAMLATRACAHCCATMAHPLLYGFSCAHLPMG